MSLCFVAFLMLFSLDVFEEGLSAGQIALGLFMHNIPALVLLTVVIISWKRELVGGVVFILAGLAYIVLLAFRNFEWFMLVWILQIAGPAFGIGIFFILGWLEKRKLQKTS